MATPTDLELGNLVSNSDFQARCTEAAANFASSILIEASSTANHVARMRWAKAAILNPWGAVQNLLYAITRDPKFTTQDPLNVAGMLDTDFRAAVEATINTAILQQY